jgi:site-specific DNA-methyltransferase (adenine-specific)
MDAEAKAEGAPVYGKCPRCRTPLVVARIGRPRRYCSSACRQSAYRRRQRASVHFRSQSDEWATPQELFDKLAARFGGFTLDCCATADNAKCAAYFTRADDGLAQTWTGRVWCNPPYGRAIGLWLRKALESVQSGSAELVVCLVPARTDTAWWHDIAAKGEVEFLPGRVRFGGASSGAPFPSAVVVFRNAAGVTEVA